MQENDTVLHVTAKWGVEEVAKWLLNYGADYTIKNRVRNVQKASTVTMYVIKVLFICS